jgi:hypothetical protein
MSPRFCCPPVFGMAGKWNVARRDGRRRACRGEDSRMDRGLKVGDLAGLIRIYATYSTANMQTAARA